MVDNNIKNIFPLKTHNDSNQECDDKNYAMYDKSDIKELLYLAGIKSLSHEKDHFCDHDLCGNNTCDCECHKNTKEVLQYKLDDFSTELKSTFNSINFENWLDAFNSFRLKMINKGFSPEASERIVFEILNDFYKKKNFNESENKNAQINDFNKPKQEISLTMLLDKNEKYSGDINFEVNDEEDLKKVLKLAGLVMDNFASEKKENGSNKSLQKVCENENNLEGMYILELNLKNKNDSKEKKVIGKIKLMASNKEDLENAMDMLINYIQEIKNKNLQKSDFKFVQNRKDIKECEIIVDRSPYLIGDKRIFAPSGLDTLNTRLINQKFVKYGDNPLTYEEEKKILEEKLKTKLNKFKRRK